MNSGGWTFTSLHLRPRIIQRGCQNGNEFWSPKSFLMTLGPGMVHIKLMQIVSCSLPFWGYVSSSQLISAGHGVAMETLSRAREMSLSFFDLPLEAKKRCSAACRFVCRGCKIININILGVQTSWLEGRACDGGYCYLELYPRGNLIGTVGWSGSPVPSNHGICPRFTAWSEIVPWRGCLEQPLVGIYQQ